MSDNKALKFLHFNVNLKGRNSKRTREFYQSRTVAALALSPNSIIKTAKDFLALEAGKELHIPMAVGVTLVSFDDLYNRAKGRDEAVKAMAEIDLKVNSVNINETHVYVNLAAHKGVELSLRLNRKTGFSSVLGQIVGPGK